MTASLVLEWARCKGHQRSQVRERTVNSQVEAGDARLMKGILMVSGEGFYNHRQATKSLFNSPSGDGVESNTQK
jgi:hypothetical protein